ncbi:hypothetical protein SDC9_198914 [bioreactor metagenome]|uniref:Uncharacterized protein n=1 Tax=bioreactor metagenome TaxID=1076179 RepID=A0A645IJ10_9ZZZZ
MARVEIPVSKMAMTIPSACGEVFVFDFSAVQLLKIAIASNRANITFFIRSSHIKVRASLLGNPILTFDYFTYFCGKPCGIGYPSVPTTQLLEPYWVFAFTHFLRALIRFSVPKPQSLLKADVAEVK